MDENVITALDVDESWASQFLLRMVISTFGG
jgi:hypothetical protein